VESQRFYFSFDRVFRENPSFDRIWSWKSGNVTLKIHDAVCARQPLPERVGLFWGLTAMGLEFVRNGTSRLPFRPIYLVCSRFCDYRKVPRTKDPLGINTEMKFLDPTKIITTQVSSLSGLVLISNTLVGGTYLSE